MMPMQRFRRAIKATILATLVGSILAAVIFCVAEVIDGSQIRGAADLFILPGVALIAGISGLIVSIPCALIVGGPLIWLFENQFAASPARFAVIMAIIGAALGWALFKMMFDDGLGIFIDATRYACPIFGATIAGLIPLFTEWLLRPLPGAE